MADCKCDVEVALAWAMSARNALSNNSGFSPNQLVFGYNPAIPSVHDSIPPGFARALRHNIRSTDLSDIDNGNEVYYKRNKSHEWHGPDTLSKF